MKAYVEPKEISMMERATTNLRNKLLIRLLFHLGCRISEALAISVDDIDFTQGTVTIVHLKSRVERYCSNCGARLGISHTFCPKCGNKVENTQLEQREHRRQRVLPVEAETLGMLNDYIKRGGTVEKDGKRLIFGINRHRAWQIVKQCAENVGLPRLVNPETGGVHNVSPHRIRDSFAVNAVKHNDTGDGLRMLQEHLGHSSFNTTAKYRKISGKEHRDWYDKLFNGEKQ